MVQNVPDLGDIRKLKMIFFEPQTRFIEGKWRDSKMGPNAGPDSLLKNTSNP
jgi:hypothetical protein